MDSPHSPNLPPPALSRHRTAFAVVAVCFALGFTGRGLVESFVVFLLPLSQSFGWDRASVVSIYSLSLLVTGLGGPVVGRLFDRTGPRAVYTLGLLLLGSGLSAAAFAEALWQFQLCIGLAVGGGACCLGNVPNAALLGRWFAARLTVATSVVFSAFGIGILVLVPSAQALIEALGWRHAYHWLGGIVLVLVVPLLLLPWRTYHAGDTLRPRPSAVAHGVDGWTLLRAMRHGPFWALFAVYLFTGMAMFAIVAQVVAYLVAAGFSPMEAATAWGFTGVLLPVGMIVVGWLDGIIGRVPSVLLSYAVSLVGVGLLWLVGRFPSAWLLTAFVICFGSTLGSRGPLISTIALRLYSGRDVATILGTIGIGGGLGSALGSWIGGVLHDWSGSYEPGIIFAALSIAGGALPFLTVPALRR